MGEPLLLDTAPLRDQRTMVGDGVHKTVQDVEEAWRKWADQYGLQIRQRRGDYSRDLRESRKALVVYVSGGRWIADCPSCSGGVAAWPGHERGCCLDCGTIYRLTYPPHNQIGQAVRLLAEREENQRHWYVHHGETVEKLEAENTLLRRTSILEGAVSMDAIRSVLGHDAIAKLQQAGVV